MSGKEIIVREENFMRLTNYTKWDDRDLRRFIERCIKEVGLESNGREVVIRNASHPSLYGGLGSYHRKWIMVKIPRENLDMREFAKITIHELHHNIGLHHKDMIPSDDIECDWATEYIIRPARPKLKKVRNIRQERYDHTLKLIKKNERKFKSTQTRLKALYNKKQYYEKTMVC